MKLINGLEFTDKDIHCIISKVLNANFYQHQKDGKFGFKPNKDIELANDDVIVEITGNALPEYNGKPKEYRKIFEKYYKENLAGKKIVNSILGEIEFFNHQAGETFSKNKQQIIKRNKTNRGTRYITT